MSLNTAIHTVESHTEGMPTRIVIEGAPVVPGITMGERLAWAELHLQDLRKFLMQEPRGHAAMFGAILMPPTQPHADIGVLFMSASGFLPMCGHGTIGIATVLVERGMVAVTEPVTEVRLDTPAGPVLARVVVEAGRALNVSFTNVASFVVARDAPVDVPGLGLVPIDVAYGGNFYAILDLSRLGIELVLPDLERLTELGLAVIDATRRQVPFTHPIDPALTQLRAAILASPPTDGRPARNLMVKEARYFDRSPCGTGTSARMALLHGRGALRLNETFVHESILGTRFEGHLVAETEVGGISAVVPRITGRAWITGTCNFLLAPGDPFPTGFALHGLP